jgi:hypothetical protein
VRFYRRFFGQILERDIARAHVCFDLGHAKVWATDSLADWLALLGDLAAAGLRLHFHLHANRGLADEHLSFIEAERIGITGPDAFAGPRDYLVRDLSGRRSRARPEPTHRVVLPTHDGTPSLS